MLRILNSYAEGVSAAVYASSLGGSHSGRGVTDSAGDCTGRNPMALSFIG